MDEHELLRRLAAHVEQTDIVPTDFDPRWRQLAAGTLSAEELEALRAKAGEDAAMLEDLFRPMEASFRSQLAAQWTKERKYPARPTSSNWWLSKRRAALAFAAVAAVALIWISVPFTTVHPALPHYTLTTEGHTKIWRGTPSPGALDHYQQGAPLQWLLRPDEPFADEVKVRVFLRSGEKTQEWPVDVEISQSGAIRLSGSVGVELDAPQGTHEVLVVVASPGVQIAQDSLPKLSSTRVKIFSRTLVFPAEKHE